MNTLEAARDLRSRGWAPIPVAARSKNPGFEGWQRLLLAEDDLPEHFRGGKNIGILTGEPSDGLIDVDLDCDEAVALAERVLPATAMRSGRTSRPGSHAWYRVANDLPASRTFKDEDGSTLVELRGTGRQTLVAPSLHPDGERYEWEGPLEPADVSADELDRAVHHLAAAALLARHWPRVPGSRHEIANAMAGMLLRAGWDESETTEFIYSIASTAGDDEARQRARDAVATARTLDRGRKTTGGPTLSKLLGEAVVEKVRDWLGLSTLSAFMSFMSYPSTDANPWPESLSEPAFYGVAGDFVRLVEPHTEADPAALLIQFLVAAGNLAGRGPHFLAEADQHYANLFTGIVGQSSKGRKGTAWGQTRRPLATIDEVWARERQQGGLSSGEGLVWAVRDPIMSRSPIREKGRVAGYEDVESDPGVTDKRLLVFEPELASTLRVLGRDGNTLSPMIRQAWDTGNLRVLTKNSPAVASDAHISIIGHITRDELRRYLDRTETGNGFANRFLWICAKRARVLPEGGRLETVDFAPLIRRLSETVSFIRELGSHEFRRDEAARALWHAVYPSLSEGKPGLFGTVISRAEAQVMRLALLYALLDTSKSIASVHLEAALAVWTYAEDSARYIFGDALGDPVADQILRALRSHPDGMSRTDIRDLFKRNRRAVEIDRALALLSERGLARLHVEQTDGRPAERWHSQSQYDINDRNDRRVSAPGRYRVNVVNVVSADGDTALDLAPSPSPAEDTCAPSDNAPDDDEVVL